MSANNEGFHVNNTLQKTSPTFLLSFEKCAKNSAADICRHQIMGLKLFNSIVAKLY
jgi:hypothetical protein